VRDIFARRDWNTIEDEDGNKDFGVEKFLADQVDGPAAPALEDLRHGRFPLLGWRREAVAIFMSAQLVRGRFAREALSEFISEVSGMMLRITAANYTDELWAKHIGEVPSPALRERLARGDSVEIQPTAPTIERLGIPPIEAARRVRPRRQPRESGVTPPSARWRTA
jgi:Protein of unknown function (DUF4238)